MGGDGGISRAPHAPWEVAHVHLRTAGLGSVCGVSMFIDCWIGAYMTHPCMPFPVPFPGSRLQAHELIPKIKIWGADLITVHGRSKEARYTKLADWSYIDRCAQIAAPLPFCGNGDILSYEDAVAHKTKTKVGGGGKLLCRDGTTRSYAVLGRCRGCTAAASP